MKKMLFLEAIEFERCPNVIESSTLADYVINYLSVFENIIAAFFLIFLIF